MKPIAIILHNRLSVTPTPDEADVLDQVKLAGKALAELGYNCHVRDIGMDLQEDIRKIKELSPALVFNLVETVFGKSELLHMVPSVLGALKIPYTGVSDEGLFLTTRKTLTKSLMHKYGIRTPEWFSPLGNFYPDPSKKYILKPVSEEGSVCLDEDAVFTGNNDRMMLRISKFDPDDYFVEEFIEGREFNLSVTGKPGSYQVYPVAEMLFRDFPEGKERILGYRAKWDEQSFEYQHTCREFDTLKKETELQNKLVSVARKCGEIFQLSGYFRVDVRVSQDGKPFVLEINGNPCISPDSGFIAAATRAGMSATDVVKQIIAHLN